MPSIVQEPWKKEPSTSSSQPARHASKKEMRASFTLSDEDSPEQLDDEDEDDEDDEELNPLDEEKQSQRRISESHMEIIALCKKPRDSGRKKMRPSFIKGGPALEDFKKQYKDVLNSSGDDKRTLLHHLAKRITKSLLPLLRWLLNTYPDLILRTDSEDHTALYTAMSSLNAIFVEYVCEYSEKKVEALQQNGIDGTCLHKALELGSSEVSIMKAVDRIIQELKKPRDTQRQGDGEASSILKNVLCKRDKKGNTPLHVALTTIASYHARRDQSASASVTLLETNLRSIVTLAIEVIKEHPETMYERNKETKSPYDCLGPAKEMEVCTEMLEEMKKGIMRKFSHDEVINLLYADGGNGM